MTFEINQGSNIAPRTRIDWVSRCIIAAITTARIVCRVMLIRTYSMVTLSAL